MQIDRRITSGLAWAGVFLVVGVPAADLLSAQLMGEGRAPQVAALEVEAPALVPAGTRPAAIPDVAVVAPAAPTGSGGVVDGFLQSGKPLPSYITDGEPAQAVAPAGVKPATPVAAPAPVNQAAVPATPVPAQSATDPVQVASIPAPPKVAPIPMPLSMRPAMPVPVVAATEPALIIPDRAVAPLPPVTFNADDLDDWESGPLSEYLAARQKGGAAGQSDAYYEEDGFYLDEGSNAPLYPRDRLIGPANDVTFIPFSN